MPELVLNLPPPTAVIVTWPVLPMTWMASWITLSCRMPTVMIARSASSPQVVSRTKSNASSAVAKVCVAPNTLAISRLNSTGSTTTTFFAPANRAARTVDHHGLPGTRITRPHRRTPARRHAAGHERGDVEADLVRDLDDGELM